MKDIDFSIQKLHQYIDGELSAEESLYVEQQLAHDSQWRDAYEGLVFANDQQINTQKVTEQLGKRLPDLDKKQAPVVNLFGDKRWFYAAASIIGIVFVSFGLIYLLNHTAQTEMHAEAVGHAPSDGFYPEDQIQIIAPRDEMPVKKQHFDSEKIDALAKLEPNDLDDYDSFKSNRNQAEKIQLDAASDDELNTESASQIKKEVNSVDKPSYNLISRYGYSEVKNPNLFNTTRGANATGSNRPPVIAKHALSPAAIQSLKQEYEGKYFARFPFNGIVKTQFYINEEGEVEHFRVLNTPNKEMADVVQEFAQEKIQWGTPQLRTGQATSELVNLEVSFGNTISIDIGFAGS